MTPYNVEIFDHTLTCIFHDSVSVASIDEDYLAPNASTIVLRKTDAVTASEFIHISGAYDFFGIITNVSSTQLYTEVSFKPFVTLFDHDCIFNTDWQNNGASLENVIKTLIDNYWSTATGADPAPTFLNVVCSTSTTSWGFNLKSDTEGKHTCIVGLYDVVLVKALTKYGIAIDVKPDFNTKKVTLTIGTRTEEQTIDADLPSVVIDTFTIHKYNGSVNKLQIVNTENYDVSQAIYYYMHTDGKYDTDGTKDRIYPVAWDVKAVTPDETTDFAHAASSAASSTFSGSNWKDEIELIVDKNDRLINPMGLKIGQTVNIMHNFSIYSTIFTGRKLDEQITLMFGTVRTDLTKVLKIGE